MARLQTSRLRTSWSHGWRGESRESGGPDNFDPLRSCRRIKSHYWRIPVCASPASFARDIMLRSAMRVAIDIDSEARGRIGLPTQRYRPGGRTLGSWPPADLCLQMSFTFVRWLSQSPPRESSRRRAYPSRKVICIPRGGMTPRRVHRHSCCYRIHPISR
jgi:hypothetical protein